MSDDLVQRLQDGVIWDGRDVDPFATGALVHEAADRIEALEAALRQIDALCHQWPTFPLGNDISRIAREALDA